MYSTPRCRFSLSTAMSLLLCLVVLLPAQGWALTSNNLPLDSPVYHYLDKLAAFGLITDDFRGIRPITGSEAARLLLQAEGALGKLKTATPGSGESGGLLGDELVSELRSLLKREILLRQQPEEAPALALRPLSGLKVRYVYLDGVPRDYRRQVHDPGGEGVFGIGAGLRPINPPDAVVTQQGSEGTPLMENSEGIRYRRGSNGELRFTSELFLGTGATALAEPLLLHGERQGDTLFRLQKGYLKLGGGGLELELGRDANWLGLGERGAITLTNNSQNLDLIKLSSPEPVGAGFLGQLKYSLIFSRLDRELTERGERQPWFLAGKISLKPDPSLEIGLNLGRQFGGPGVDNGLGATLRGLVGGTNRDNSNSLAGLELRWRIASLRNSELYGEFSGEDAAKFWPIVESYLAGLFIPRLTDDGRNDFRFEYFQGNQILYTHSAFTEGYLYHGLPLGHSQGGATQDFSFRLRHWFAPRNCLGLDYLLTYRGKGGRLEGQSLERKYAWRAAWNLPVMDILDLRLTGGWERVTNLNLVEGAGRENRLLAVDLAYRF